MLLSILTWASMPSVAPGASHATDAVPQPSIKLNKSIRGIRLGFTPAQVVSTLGQPQSIVPDEGSATETYDYDRVSVQFLDGRVRYVLTYTPLDRTKKNIGVGSSVSAVKNGLRNEGCNRTNCAVTKTSKSGAVARTSFGFHGKAGKRKVYSVTLECYSTKRLCRT